jgi:hypothetical protein
MKANDCDEVCRNCHENKVNRPRGLCWHCYYTPGVQELYPSTSKYARRGNGNHNLSESLPNAPEPMTTADRTERVKVMAWRAANGFDLFHPDDSRHVEEPPIFLEPKTVRIYTLHLGEQ